MAREKEESAAVALDRMRLLFKRSGGRAKMTKDEILASCPTLEVYGVPNAGDDSAPFQRLDASLTNKEFWPRAREILVGSEKHKVALQYNIPTITSITPPKTPYVGLPLVCSNITTLFSTDADMRYEWLETVQGGSEPRVISRDPVLLPTEDLLGKSITLRVSPGAQEGSWSQILLPPVQSAPPPVDRWKLTKEPVSTPHFRVVSYNILYEDFCTGRHARTHIYPFATDDVLDPENRSARVLQELLAYNADIICLQECGKKVFRTFLLPAMRTKGYDGVYANKSGSVQEGCGILFRSTRYKLAVSETTPLSWGTVSTQFTSLAEQIEPHKEFKEALQNVTNIALVLLLEELETGKRLVVGNTHLFFHANACHIRLVQAYIYLDALNRMATKESATSRLPIVMCGDCNCTHSTGAYRLFTTGQVEKIHHSWEKGKLFFWGCDRQLGYSGETLESVAVSEAISEEAAATKKRVVEERAPLETCFSQSLVAKLRLTDAYFRMDPSLPWTNYTLSFKEVVDYIMFSGDNLDVTQTIPIPSEAELSEQYALPNKNYPSDHVALIADLLMKGA
ncbi:hypothetical protein AGDE_11217 [Angomonas deanei]|nr:hypothetical protein AGDE_11217 [Angomonas deanei]|eukprot:EPY26544.1 hypothetical protein AGDE_11217 [Angomonas deanei]